MVWVVREEAIDWFEEGRVDLRRARRSLEYGDFSLLCYLSQQAIEKVLKAVLIGVKRVRPPHLHDLTVLYGMICDVLPLPDDIRDRIAEVSQYYVTARCPNAGLMRPSESFSRSQAERALEVARYVVGEVEKTLTTG